jgi:ribosomal protein S18 acetylase RimI-like enzyme
LRGGPLAYHPIVRITTLPLATGDRHAALPDLVHLLREAVEDGASVGFLHPLDDEAAQGYWIDRLREARDGRRLALAAWDDEVLVGSVQLAFAAQPNGRHRAEVQRLLVRRGWRHRGIATALMTALEEMARAHGRTLLVLNTRSDDGPERLYERLGYAAAGRIPDFARNPDGSFNTTTIMWRRLDVP